MRKTAIFVIYFICSLYVFLLGVRQPNIDGYERARFGEMVQGTAHRPFVYRTLLPSVIRGIESLVPDSAEESLKQSIDRVFPFGKIINKMGWDEQYYFEYLIGLPLMLACLIAFMYSLSWLARGLFAGQDWIFPLIAVAAMLVLPAMFRYYIYIYDFPTLLLFTLALALMAHRRWRWYYVVFVLAAINKETAILLAFFWMILLRRERLRDPLKYWITAAAQVMAFVALKLVITLIYLDNSGVPAEFNFLEHNFAILFSPHSVQGVISVIVIFILLFYRWREKPQFLRLALLMGIPLLALGIFWGVIDEFRIFYEIYAVIWLLAGHTLSLMAGFGLEPRPNEWRLT
ncbi:MAG: hypothetical protein ACOCX7_05145 [Bacteroidota bacterium]